MQASKFLGFDHSDRVENMSEQELIEALLRHINGRYDMTNPHRHALVLKCVEGGGTVPAEFRKKYSGPIPPAAFDEVEKVYADLTDEKER